MGRFEIARNDKNDPVKDEKSGQGPSLITRARDLIASRPVRKPMSPERYLYTSPPAYPLEEGDIRTEQAVTPSRNVTIQWPMGHRTILPFRNLTFSVSEQGTLTLQVPESEARRIAEDVEQAHRRFDNGTSSLGPH